MLMLLDYMFLSAKTRFVKFVDGFRKDETGVSAIVATVLLILIVVLLAAVFWENLQKWFDGMWEKITNKADTIS